MSELTPTTLGLLRAARKDGPGAAGRAQIWNGVAAKAAGGTALGAAGAKTAATAATAKLFAMGALLGSAVTVGLAAMVLHIGAPSLRPDPALDVHADTEGATIAPAARPTAFATPEAAPRGEALRRAPAHIHTDEDSLGREAALVAEARGAVMRGEPEVALNALHAAEMLSAHALAPEELSLEVKALRALGRFDEANATDAKLRARFPEHALAR